MLHITLTAANSLRAAGLPGEVAAWDASPHTRLDAQQDEIVLWFGETTAEQVALLNAVAACPEGTPVSFICTEPDLAHAAPERLTWLFHHRPVAGAAFFRLCARAHDALHAGTAEAIEQALPHLNALPLVQQALRATRAAPRT